MRKEYDVRLLRVHNGNTEQITTGESYVQSSIIDRVFLARRSYPDGSYIYFITLVDVSLSDRGKYLCNVYSVYKYLCNVYSVNEGDFDKIASDAKTI